jgi:small nuclear ribonucleoprotein (snRNP)-like protein
LPTSIVALELLLILLPGFAAAYIVQLLALRGIQTDFDKVIEACLYSCLVYGSFVLLTHGTLPFDVIPPQPPATDTILRWHQNRLLGLGALTLAWSIGGAIYINRDGNWIFRWFNITERTSRRSIWNDIFQKEAMRDQIVQVELRDGRSVLGVLKYYSDSSEDCSLYVSNAAWVDQSGEATAIPGSGILLTKNADIQSVSLLDPVKE